MKDLFMYAIRTAVDWLFRRRSPALVIINIGLACLVLAFGAGWTLDVSVPFNDGSIDFGFDSSGGTPVIIVYIVFVLAVLLITTGIIMSMYIFLAERRRLARKKVIVIEARGLRDTSGAPLSDAVPQHLEGNKEQAFLDIRQRIKDGEVVDPAAALNEIASLPADIGRRQGGLDRSDFTIVYGGLTPVPFTFLTGVLIDDEGVVFIMDWDRHTENWRKLDGVDDGKRFEVLGLDSLQGDAREVILAVSVSYRVDIGGVRSKIANAPIIELALEDGSANCHWSEDKQRELGRQFLNTLINLGNRGVRRVHLFFAAQNSVVFRFGRLYDKRNLPEVVVYQYQRDAVPPYPWGVLMPVGGVKEPAIISD